MTLRQALVEELHGELDEKLYTSFSNRVTDRMFDFLAGSFFVLLDRQIYRHHIDQLSEEDL